MIYIRQMKGSDIGRIAEIDRSEHVTQAYLYRDGKLEPEKVDWHVPRWFTDGHPEHSVRAKIKAWTPYLEQGGQIFGAFDGDLLVGVAILRPKLAEDMVQLAVLHVSKDFRRLGIATELATEIIGLAQVEEAKRVYVSATPSESAVGFYRKQGFRLAEKPHPELFALEPEDIHMIKTL